MDDITRPRDQAAFQERLHQAERRHSRDRWMVRCPPDWVVHAAEALFFTVLFVLALGWAALGN